jgi:hypothetical protein
MIISLKIKMRAKSASIHQNDSKIFFVVEYLLAIKNYSKIMIYLNIKFICLQFMFD